MLVIWVWGLLYCHGYHCHFRKRMKTKNVFYLILSDLHLIRNMRVPKLKKKVSSLLKNVLERL